MTGQAATICIYCGSRAGRRAGHVNVARATGRALGRAGFAVVYGAGDLGLMGETARAARAAGARVTGFIPRHLFELEVCKSDIDALIVTETMHERKKLMFGNSDAVLALPGGPGTLDELIEVLTWRHLGLHDKPVVLLNPEDYWGPLLALFDHMIDEGFVGAPFRDYFTVVETVDEAIAALREALSPIRSMVE
ncbi:TIGR00730 family Rossman fold protein [Limibaculum sp. FT325]|uniref:LOG family protein n=1 Tax=Thermohalobaculum sediminis TaxID=2939436 RepID=UPI0020BDE8D8|nr:TIGR00730 family Rossman fold protein [Limibaculum sediminis]MCL5775468.1 TIGR00730 family Rossman fold protein [Limibaculum sediminis]